MTATCEALINELIGSPIGTYPPMRESYASPCPVNSTTLVFADRILIFSAA